MGRDEMRAGDQDRQAVADRLKVALDEGRLDLHEYDERLQKTYAAKTFGDLNGLLDDLPGTAPPQQSRVAPYQAAPPAPAQQEHQHSPSAWVYPYGGVILVCIAIWAITSISSGHLNYFWPVWLLIPLIFGIFGRLASRGSRGGYPDRQARRAARRDRRYR
ncbi:MAG TPA: DUF1707 domain-containing protein [Actinomycetes bacterium]|jgi:hypothetical protein|nr:DUF1707 domain-containing protein [Actinomycetes bacterium]